MLHDLTNNANQTISGIHMLNDPVMGIAFWGDRILSVSGSGKLVSWTDPNDRKEIKDIGEQITHFSFQPGPTTLLKLAVATFRGTVAVLDYNPPVAGDAGSINELSYATPGQRPVIADCGMTTIGDTQLIYAATGKGQLRLYAVN